MRRIGPIALILLSAVVLSSCTGSGSVEFAPFTSVEAPHEPVTAMAIELRPGDRQYLTKVNPKVLGWIHSQADEANDLVIEAAKVEAAKKGGTHILLRSSRKELSVEHIPFAPWGTQRIDESYRLSYVVLRVSPDLWGELPDVLQPKALTGD